MVAGFIALSIFVILVPATFLDVYISQEVQEHSNSVFDKLMVAVSWFGNMPQSILMVVGAASLFLASRYKKEALYIVCTLLSGIVSSVLKLVFNRPRPAADFVRIVEETRQQSFPSGHTLFYTVFFGMFIVIMGNLKRTALWLRVAVSILSSALIFLIPISRVYLGAHWFTDVLGGFILGIILLSFLGRRYLRITAPLSGKHDNSFQADAQIKRDKGGQSV
ncbi:hypothetical protein VF12_38185 [Nostoc linckia z15]|nr:hypothetical protein VF12_38185 [Nostoc linckia z15]